MEGKRREERRRRIGSVKLPDLVSESRGYEVERRREKERKRESLNRIK